VLFNKLFIFELANNHNGDLQHGIDIIREISKVAKRYDFKFGFKLQYRDLDTFIHPDFKTAEGYVKRFEDTRLTNKELKTLKDEICREGFIPICTPFDERSVDLIEKHGFEAIKIGSCSFTDWSLLERIAQTDLPIIASTASATLKEIDQVVTFFEHRNKEFCIMHCIGEYPTKRANLQLNQIDLLKQRYPNIAIGFSTHEEPYNVSAIKIAIAKGARVFERHVAMGLHNTYSSTPGQINNWLQSAKDTYSMEGIENARCHINNLIELKRGVFAKINLKKGEKLNKDNVFYAIPCRQGQLTANDMSKYTEYIVSKKLKAKEAVELKKLKVRNLREKFFEIMKELKVIILKSHITLPEKVDFDLSHHYGIERFKKWGATILSCINREYCKKIIILLPKQKHPFHYHLKKEETFQVLYGNMDVTIDKKIKLLKVGDILTIERSKMHNFSSKEGVIFEEISTTDYKDDSFYEDKTISKNKDRKTCMTFKSDWLVKDDKKWY